MPHCLMLDVDGVLISGRPNDGKFWTHTLQADLGLSPDDLVQAFFTPLWPQVVTGQRDLRPALIEALAHLDTNLDADTLIDYWFRMDSRIVAPVLKDVRAARRDGMRVFLATNQDHARAHYLMNELNLRAEVDGILSSAQAGVQKPDSGFYAFAQDVAQAKPSEILFVDDTLQNIDAARTAGWTALHWTSDMCLADFVKRKTP